MLDLNEIDSLPVYVDGADEIDHSGAMIKGGGGALTREKIVASVSDVFVCIADASKLVDTLGNFPLPIEVVPMARTAIGRRVTALGGVPVVRVTKEGTPFITDNGNEIIDVKGLRIDSDPRTLETHINAWPGVVTVGLFAGRGANLRTARHGHRRTDHRVPQGLSNNPGATHRAGTAGPSFPLTRITLPAARPGISSPAGRCIAVSRRNIERVAHRKAN